MAIILTGLENVISFVYMGFRFSIGTASGILYIERFIYDSSENVPWQNGNDRIAVLVGGNPLAGEYAGFVVKGGKLCIDVPGQGFYVSHDFGETWESF